MTTFLALTLQKLLSYSSASLVFIPPNKAHYISLPSEKKTHLVEVGFTIKRLAVTYFHMGTPTLSSALSGFTSEFEMGSGGSRLLWPPGKTGCLLVVITQYSVIFRFD